MQVLDGEKELGGVNAGLLLAEGDLAGQVEGEVLTRAVVQGEVQIVGGLEGVVKIDYEGVVGLFQHFGLGDGVFQLFLNNQILLLECLQSIYNPTLDMLGHEHLPEGPRPQHLHNLKRRKINLLVRNLTQLTRQLILGHLHILPLLILLLNIHRYLMPTLRPVLIIGLIAPP